MKVTLPVSMFPLSASASSSGGLVLLVMAGLALYFAAQNKQSTPSKQASNNA